MIGPTLFVAQANAQRRLGQIAKEKEVWIQKEAAGLLPSQTVNDKLQALAAQKSVTWRICNATNQVSYAC